MTAAHRLLAPFAVILTVGCSSGGSAPSGKGRVEPPAEPSEPDPATADACPRLAGGVPGTRAPLVDFARAVAAHRFFGPGTDFAPAETALAETLAGGSTIDDEAIAAFADGLDGVCVHAADPR